MGLEGTGLEGMGLVALQLGIVELAAVLAEIFVVLAGTAVAFVEFVFEPLVLAVQAVGLVSGPPFEPAVVLFEFHFVQLALVAALQLGLAE